MHSKNTYLKLDQGTFEIQMLLESIQIQTKRKDDSFTDDLLKKAWKTSNVHYVLLDKDNVRYFFENKATASVSTVYTHTLESI